MSFAPLRRRARLSPAWLAAAAGGLLLGGPAALAFKPPVADNAPPAAAPAQPTPPQQPAQQKPAKKKETAPTKPAQSATKKERGNATSSQTIIVLVNDEPITGYEVDQRMRLALLGSPEMQHRLRAKLKAPNMDERFKKFAIAKLKANPPKSQEEQQQRVKQLQAEFVQSLQQEIEREYLPTVRKSALDELIEERLKMQEAKRLSAIAGTDEVDRVVKSMAERNKLTAEEFAQQVKKSGADIREMRMRIMASLSWAAVIRRRFGREIALAASDLERVVTSVGGPSDVELHVQRILLPLPAGVTQQRLAQRLGEAERVRAGYTGCAGMNGLAASVASGARFDDLGQRRPASIDEPTRSLLLSAKDGEMLPPTVSDGGVELWALCGRKAIKAEGQTQDVDGNQEIRQKEFEILSKKHLKDLRQDAHIEYRG